MNEIVGAARARKIQYTAARIEVGRIYKKAGKVKITGRVHSCAASINIDVEGFCPEEAGACGYFLNEAAAVRRCRELKCSCTGIKVYRLRERSGNTDVAAGILQNVDRA